jgi:hypothetical protein
MQALRDFCVAGIEKGMRPTMARLTLARKIVAITITKIKDAAEMGAASSTEGGRHEKFISSRFFVTNMAPLLCNGSLRSCAVVFTSNAWTGANSKRANEASHARRC